MRIRSLYIILMVIFCAIFCIIGISAFLTGTAVSEIEEQEYLAKDIVMSTYQISFLANDYFLHPDEIRQNIQWESRFSALSRDIDRLEGNSPKQQELIADLKDHEARLREIYLQSVATIEDYRESNPDKPVEMEFLSTAWGRFIIQNQAMIFDASQLSNLMHEDVERLHSLNNLVILSLIGTFLGILLVNAYILNRRIFSSIQALREGSTIIGTGDLDHHIAILYDDEIGDLAHDFNTMGQNLKQVTASKEELEKSERLFRGVFENAYNYLGLLNTDGSLIYANETSLLLVDADCENLHEVPIWDAPWWTYSGTERELLKSAVFRAAKGETVRYEAHASGKDGDMVYVDLTLKPLQDEGGNPILLIAEGRDITDQKCAETAVRRKNEELKKQYAELATSETNLRESEERYRNVVETQTEFICRFLPDGTLTFVNTAYAGYFGTTPEEMEGRIIQGHIFPEDREAVHLHFTSLTPQHPVLGIEHRTVMPDGEIRWNRWSDHAFFDASGHVLEYQSIGRDITTEKEARDRERIAIKRIEENIEQLASLNDQIRNPLAIIVGLVDLDCPDLLDSVIQQADKIDRVVNQLDVKWEDSVKVWEFLRKHYGIGEDAEEPGGNTNGTD